MVLKIIGIILAVIILLIVLLLFSRVKLVLGLYDEGKFGFKVKLLCFSFGGNKKDDKKKDEEKGKKPESEFTKKLKAKLGLDILDKEELKASVEEGSFTDKASRLAALVLLFLGQVKYLFSKIRVDRLYSLLICGGSGAEAAIDYGIVCSAVYPLAGYLDASLNMKRNAQNIQIYCDFDNESRIEFELILSVRIMYILKAVIGALNEAYFISKKMEERQNGN